MDVYLFIQTDPGLAGTVMSSIVEQKAVSRAAVVTGWFDVFARIDDVTWDELTDRVLDRVQRVPGVSRTTTAVVTPFRDLGRTMSGPIHPPTLPLRMPPLKREPRTGLVFAKIHAGAGPEVIGALSANKNLPAFAMITGDDDIIIQVSGRDVAHIGQKVVRDIGSVAGVAFTRTALVVRSTPLVKPKRGSRK